jgi:hypothetical protein
MIRKAAAAALWLTAVYLALAVSFGFRAAMRVEQAPFLAAVLLSSGCQIAVLLLRSKSIARLDDSPDVAPIIALLLRTAGECLAIRSFVLGLGAALCLWFSKQNPLASFPATLLPSEALSSGLLMLLGSAILAIVTLIFFYFLAELSHSTPVDTRKICPTCQFEVPPSGNSCPICGTAVTS